MKAVKKILVGATVVVLIAFVALAVVRYSSAVQTALVRYFFGHGEERSIQLERVQCRLDGFIIEGLKLELSDKTIAVERLDVAIDVLAALWSKAVRIEHIRVTGLHVGLHGEGHSSPNAVQTAIPDDLADDPVDLVVISEDFAGLLAATQRGYRLYLDKADLRGQVEFADGSRADLTVTGGAVAPGRTGSLVFSLVASREGASFLSDPRTGIALASWAGRLDLSQSHHTTGFTAMRLTASLLARGEILGGEKNFLVQLRFKQQPDNEIYTLKLRPIGTEGQAGQALIQATQTFDPARQYFSGDFRINTTAMPLPPQLIESVPWLRESLVLTGQTELQWRGHALRVNTLRLRLQKPEGLLDPLGQQIR